MESIIVSAITGLFSIVGVIITSAASANKLQKQLEISQAVTNTKLEALTAEVRKHNEFAMRIPVIEEKIKALEKRLDDLERDKT